MSDATRFLETVYGNQDLQNEVVGIKTIDEIVAQGASLGYTFTADELEAAQTEFYQTHGVAELELDEAALEMVAGGKEAVIIATVVVA